MYQLITFPDVQEYMEYSWFTRECYLVMATDEQEHFDSAYFIPQQRIDEVASNPELNIMEEE